MSDEKKDFRKIADEAVALEKIKELEAYYGEPVMPKAGERKDRGGDERMGAMMSDDPLAQKMIKHSVKSLMKMLSKEGLSDDERRKLQGDLRNLLELLDN